MDIVKELSLAMLHVLDDPTGVRVVVNTNIPCLGINDDEQTVTYLIDLSDGGGRVVYDYWHVTNYDNGGREFKSNIDVLNFFQGFPEGAIESIYADSY